MDFIGHCLSLVPVPYLSPAFSVFRGILSSVQRAQASKQQLKVLTQSIAQLLGTIDKEYRAQRLLKSKTSTPLADLHGLLTEISSFVEKEADRAFLNLLFTADARISRIDQYHRSVGAIATSFQISALLNIQAWQLSNDRARVIDQQDLNKRLLYLEMNQQKLMECIDAHQRNMVAMMVSLERRLQIGSDEDREQKFFRCALEHLKSASGRHVEIEKWMITSYEVEFGDEIGSGGFGRVYKGSWNKTNVALKVLMVEEGVAPSSPIAQSIYNEIKIWSELRHPNILQFLGANILDEKPFIVTRYLRNGNARHYLQKHPDHDRLQILHDMSLGLVHLHSLGIVHGDLKALNVLIDDGGSAVLCDFGLSRIQPDVTSPTMKLGWGHIVGSRYWMAPERLLGGPLTKPCDIYAFAMTLYEIFTNTTPLSGIDYAEFTEQVARQDVRPKRPDDKVAPQLSDTAWELAKRCWVKEPECRPIATVVYDALTYILSSTTTQPALIPSHTPVIVPPPSTPPPHAPVEPYPHRSFSPPPNLIWRYTSLVYGAAFSPDGKYIVSGSRDCKIIVWDAQTGKPILRPPKKHDDFVSCVTFSPDGRRIASGSWDRTILVWDSLTGKVVTRPFKGHNHVIGCISFSHDGKWIASGSWDKTIRVWDAQRGILLVGPLKAHADNVSSVAFSVDGTLLVSGSGSKKIRVWDARSGQLIRKVKGHADTRFVAFSLDGERIVSAHSQGNVCVWNTDTGGLISGPSKRHAEGTLAAVFASNSTLLCAVSPDGNLMAAKDGDVSKVWDLKTGRCVATFSDSTKDVWSFAFSPDNKRILTTSDDTICVRTINMLPMTREHTNQDDGQSCIIH